MLILRLAVVALLVPGCASEFAPTPAAEPPVAQRPRDVTLPAGDELLPAGLAGATVWGQYEELPQELAAGVAFASTEELVDAYRAHLLRRFATSQPPPRIATRAVEEHVDRALVLVTESGTGDDSVAGSQHALSLLRNGEGWTLEAVWSRTLCRRAVDGELCV